MAKRIPNTRSLCKKKERSKSRNADFLDFTVSYEVQRLLAEQFCRRSVRKDLPSALMPLEDISLVDYDVEEASAGRDAVLMTWAFYLGGEEAP